MQVLFSPIRTPNVHPLERWLSVASGTFLTVHGLRRRGIASTLAGAMMLQRGLTGKCELYRVFGVRTAPHDGVLPYELGVRARASITIGQARETLFQFWRQLENLPRFMRHLLSVHVEENGRSSWEAEGPGGRRYRWTAEIINEVPNELLAWKSLPGSDVDSAGSVRFMDAPGGRGTEIHVELQYNPPAGAAGAYAARLLGREPEQEIRRDLKRLKQQMEAGEVATTDGQPQGSQSPRITTVEKAIEQVVA